eukprot:761205-Hanusia_phi.AAC.9
MAWSTRRRTVALPTVKRTVVGSSRRTSLASVRFCSELLRRRSCRLSKGGKDARTSGETPRGHTPGGMTTPCPSVKVKMQAAAFEVVPADDPHLASTNLRGEGVVVTGKVDVAEGEKDMEVSVKYK